MIPKPGSASGASNGGDYNLMRESQSSKTPSAAGRAIISAGTKPFVKEKINLTSSKKTLPPIQ